jgi:ABC-type cobalamin/Fe3+-siderophores transport system ATPase subunit
MIERLYIQNFRCLESVTFDFAGKSSALMIGKNGAGKSTTCKALAVFQRICRGSSRVDKLFSPSDFTLRNTDRPIRFEIEVSLAEKRYVYAISFDWPTNFREARILDESLSVDAQSVFTRQQAQIQLANGSAFRLDWHVFALPVIDEKPPERAIRDLNNFLGALVVTSPIPENMSGYSEQPASQLEEDASNFASCLRGLLETDFAVYAKFDEYIRSVIPDFSSIKNVDRGKDGKQLMVSFKAPDAKESLEVEFDALSAGEKCFFLSGYLIASRAAGFPTVCMWDEPDNHLSLSEVGQFIISLRKMAQRGGQFIATTHHPETVRKFSDDSTIVLTRKSHLDPTRARLLNEFSYTGDLVHALIRDEIIG